MAEYN